MNQITINFETCSPAPDGFTIIYRPLGSAEPYRDGGSALGSPAVITDSTDPDGTQYEGFIRAVMGERICPQVPFSTGEASAPCLNYHIRALSFTTVSYIDCPGGAQEMELATDDETFICSQNEPSGDIEIIGIPEACAPIS